MLEHIAQLQAHQAGELGIDGGSGSQGGLGGGIILPVECGFGFEQVARKLGLMRQLGDFFQVAFALGIVAHLVGAVYGEHQGEGAVVAGFFVFQHFGGFLLGVLEFAFEVGETGFVERGFGMMRLAAAAEAAHAAGDIDDAVNQTQQQIKQHHEHDHGAHKQMQVYRNLGLSLIDNDIHVAAVMLRDNGEADCGGKQHDNPNQAFHDSIPL